MGNTGKGKGHTRGTRHIDFLGYVFDGQCVRMRKGTKHRFAAAAKKSEGKDGAKRKQMLASYWGWCKWGDCRHLWKVLTNNDMSFAEKGILQSHRTQDGKKMFDVTEVKLMDILNTPITVLDFEADIKTKQGPGRYCVLFLDAEGKKCKFITNSYNIKDVLDQAREAENQGQKIFPVSNVVVKRRPLGEGKSAYYFDE